MSVATLHPLPPEALRLDAPLPFALRDANGGLVAARGAVIRTEAQLQALASRQLFLDETDSENLARAVAGKVDSMLRQNAPLGQIAQARPDGAASAGPVRRLHDPINVWSSLQTRARALLHQARVAANDSLGLCIFGMSVTNPNTEFLTPQNIEKIVKLLRCAFKQAVRWEMIAKNPFENAVL